MRKVKYENTKFPDDIYFFKVNIGNTRTMSEICLKLRSSCVFIVNLEQI